MSWWCLFMAMSIKWFKQGFKFQSLCSFPCVHQMKPPKEAKTVKKNPLNLLADEMRGKTVKHPLSPSTTMVPVQKTHPNQKPSVTPCAKENSHSDRGLTETNRKAVWAGSFTQTAYWLITTVRRKILSMWNNFPVMNFLEIMNQNGCALWLISTQREPCSLVPRKAAQECIFFGANVPFSGPIAVKYTRLQCWMGIITQKTKDLEIACTCSNFTPKCRGARKEFRL